jgi:hypothetical protein
VCYVHNVPRSLAAKALAERCRNDGSVLSCGEKAMRLGVSKSLVSLVQNGVRVASPELRAKCLDAYSIPLADWDVEDPESVAAEALEPPPPVSEKRPARKLGTTREELWCTVEEIDTELRGGSLSASQRASLLGKRANTLGAIARMEKAQALEDHPDFESFRADILGAMKDAFGESLGAEAYASALRAFSDSMRKRGKSKRAA